MDSAWTGQLGQDSGTDRVEIVQPGQDKRDTPTVSGQVSQARIAGMG
jgi:hypothetical protein